MKPPFLALIPQLTSPTGGLQLTRQRSLPAAVVVEGEDEGEEEGGEKEEWYNKDPRPWSRLESHL